MDPGGAPVKGGELFDTADAFALVAQEGIDGHEALARELDKRAAREREKREPSLFDLPAAEP